MFLEDDMKITIDVSDEIFKILQTQSKFTNHSTESQASAFLENAINNWYENLNEGQKIFFITTGKTCKTSKN